MIFECGQVIFPRQIAPHAHSPGVVCFGGFQPDNVMCLFIQASSLLVGLIRVFPDIPIRLIVKERSIAGVLGVDIDFAGLDRIADDAGATPLQSVFNRNTRPLQGLQHHLPQYRALGVDLGGHHHGISSHYRSGHHERYQCRCAAQKGFGSHGHSSRFLVTTISLEAASTKANGIWSCRHRPAGGQFQNRAERTSYLKSGNPTG